MAKFNQKLSIRQRLESRPDATKNYEGGLAFEMSMKNKLFTRALTSLVGEPKYYEDGLKSDTEIARLVFEIAESDPEFILQLALYARTKMHLRSLPIFLVALFTQSAGVGKVENARKYVSEIIQRPDEITELAALTMNTKKGKLPIMVKMGIKQVFESGKFNEYQLAKYNRKGQVSLRDTLFLSHPKPKDSEQAGIFARLADNDLKTPDTWETYISEHGSSKETWSYIAPKMPIFATVRNLRNFIIHGVDTSLYIPKLTNPSIIEKSRMLPFRFYSAYEQITQLNSFGEGGDPFIIKEVTNALEIAMKLSVKNIEKLPGRTFVLVDVSGSMNSAVSNMSSTSCKDISLLFGSMANYISDNALVGLFAQDFKTMHGLGPDILQNKEKMERVNVGYSTNAYLGLQYLIENRVPVDRIILFSDMQCYGYGNLAEVLEKYRRSVSGDPYLYSIDLRGYGTSQFPENDPKVSLMAGWSERIFDYIRAFETDRKTMLADIESTSV